MQKLLSIDPGLRNLSYCYLDTTPSIIQWKNICITNKNDLDSITDNLLLELQQNFDQDFEADVVIIENQPAILNGKMKTISVIIYTYFHLMRQLFGNIKQVRFVSAMNKLKCKKALLIKKDTYKDRKRASIEIARLYVNEFFPDWKERFNNLKKADDCSDTLNMLVHYCETELKIM